MLSTSLIYHTSVCLSYKSNVNVDETKEDILQGVLLKLRSLSPTIAHRTGSAPAPSRGPPRPSGCIWMTLICSAQCVHRVCKYSAMHQLDLHQVCIRCRKGVHEVSTMESCSLQKVCISSAKVCKYRISVHEICRTWIICCRKCAKSVQKCAWEQLIHRKSLQKVCKKSAFHEKKSAKVCKKFPRRRLCRLMQTFEKVCRRRLSNDASTSSSGNAQI